MHFKGANEASVAVIGNINDLIFILVPWSLRLAETRYFAASCQNRVGPKHACCDLGRESYWFVSLMRSNRSGTAEQQKSILEVFPICRSTQSFRRAVNAAKAL